MNVAEKVVEKFGGKKALQNALGHKNPTTIAGWIERKIIPAHRQIELLKLAKKQGIELKPEDFFRIAS